MKHYLQIYFSFVYCALFTFGGGYSMLPMLERVIVRKHGWVDSQELAELFALGQIVPGVVAVNVSTFIGVKRKGTLGGVFAALGAITPSIVVVTLVAAFFTAFTEKEIVRNALSGIFIAACALIISAVYKLFKACIFPDKPDKSNKRKLSQSVLHLSLIVAAFAAIVVLGASPVLIIAVTVVLAVTWSLITSRKAAS